MILAPLRGVTIRCFREVFADIIREIGFTEAVTPFIPAMAGSDPLKDKELRDQGSGIRDRGSGIRVTPQFIGKDPVALRECLEKVKAAGFETADLNAGCPYPMVRNKGRGSGLLRTPDVLRRMLEAGCEVMGAGKFSLKVRLGVDRPDELLGLMPIINEFPLRYLTVHARTARQMYEGKCDVERLREVEKLAKVPVVRNGDIPMPEVSGGRGQVSGVGCQASGIADGSRIMIGRGFVRWLGTREDCKELLERYIAVSQVELFGDASVLGRMKELISYWKELPQWKRRWNVIKICRSIDELKSAC